MRLVDMLDKLPERSLPIPEDQEFDSVPTVATLTWHPHPLGMGGEIARARFPNGFTVSILRGEPLCKPNEYEVEAIYNGEFYWDAPQVNVSRAGVGLLLAEAFHAVPPPVVEDAQ